MEHTACCTGIDVKKEPDTIAANNNVSLGESKQMIKQYFLWCWLRKENSFDQVVPNFPGWCLQNRSNDDTLQKTITTYLPPIPAKVTQFTTIIYTLYGISTEATVSMSVNMPYVNITLDIGAAMNVYKLIWNFPDKFNNVVIHLGDFHFMKENFQVILNSPFVMLPIKMIRI